MREAKVSYRGSTHFATIHTSVYSEKVEVPMKCRMGCKEAWEECRSTGESKEMTWRPGDAVRRVSHHMGQLSLLNIFPRSLMIVQS